MPDASLLTSLFPDEVVTRALVRDVELPDGAGTMALITLDNGRDHTRPNTFGPAGLLALRDALDAVTARADRGEMRSFFGEGGGGKEEFERLSSIVEILNGRFGTDLSLDVVCGPQRAEFLAAG